MELLRKVHARNLVEWARDKSEVVVLSADLTASTEIDLFRDAYPDRFFSMGIAEQNMISMAGGLAREGLTPFIHTFSVFIYRRAYDQIAVSLAYPNLPVRLFGFLPGITTPGGITHQAIEDIAVLRALPNMTIVEPGDATEVESVLDATRDVDGPVYVRMIRGEIPRLFTRGNPLQLSRFRTLSRGTDITLFSSGICTEEALRAVSVLGRLGVSIHHLHVTTHKPFADAEAAEAASAARYGVITMENHTVTGGLGTAVADAMAGRGAGKRLVKIGIRDVFLHGGSRPYLTKYYGLDAMSLVRAVEEMIGEKLEVSERDLGEIRLNPIGGEDKAEAL